MKKSAEYVLELFEKEQDIFRRKLADYADPESDPFFNFRFTGDILNAAIQLGVRGADLSFIALITTKIGRIIILRGKDKKPDVVDEAITDTLADIAVYSNLWAAMIKEEAG